MEEVKKAVRVATPAEQRVIDATKVRISELLETMAFRRKQVQGVKEESEDTIKAIQNGKYASEKAREHVNKVYNSLLITDKRLGMDLLQLDENEESLRIIDKYIADPDMLEFYLALHNLGGFAFFDKGDLEKIREGKHESQKTE